jgi:hypothetical protein
MSVLEIERQIKPLSRKEKEELFHYLAKELGEENEISKWLTPGEVLEIGTPNISPDGSHLTTAKQLQEALDNA